MFQNLKSSILGGVLLGGLAVLVASCAAIKEPQLSKVSSWELVETQGLPTARHEASLVAFDEKLYLIGGRGEKPVEEYDPKTQTWIKKSLPPIELHHFQAVAYGDAIYIVGAMTGGFPAEKPLDRVLVYYPREDRFEYTHTIPEARRRGGAGAVVSNDKIYLVAGIVNGHLDGFQPWLDVYDPKTGNWEVLFDAPNARDHFQAAIVDDVLYAFAGRRSHFKIQRVFGETFNQGDAYDIKKGLWFEDNQARNIPTERAGNNALALGKYVVIGGGESGTQIEAHNEVEAFNTETQEWEKWPNLVQGRHGSGFARIGNYLYTASGSGNRGGGPELTTLERYLIPDDVLAAE